MKRIVLCAVAASAGLLSCGSNAEVLGPVETVAPAEAEASDEATAIVDEAAAPEAVTDQSADWPQAISVWWDQFDTETKTQICAQYIATGSDANSLITSTQADPDLINLGPAGIFDDTAAVRNGVVPAANSLLSSSCAGTDTTDSATGNQWEASATPPVDITAAVLAENEFNEEPNPGVIYAGTELTMTLVSAPEGLATPGVDWTIQMEGPTRFFDQWTLNDLGCGVIPNEFDQFAELKPGATITGTVCIPIPEAELSEMKVVLDPLIFGEKIVVSP